MCRLAILALVAVALTASSHAEMERKAEFNCRPNQVCLYIWPMLPPVPGWHRDEKSSFQMGANFLLPDGLTVEESTTAIFANAIVKAEYAKDNDGHTDLAYFVAHDKETTLKDNAGAVIAEADPLVTAEGRKLPTFLITGLHGGHRQMIGYEDEGEFFVCLTYDSADEKQFNDNLPKFRAMVAAYRR